jgi:hypothetical protein
MSHVPCKQHQLAIKLISAYCVLVIDLAICSIWGALSASACMEHGIASSSHIMTLASATLYIGIWELASEELFCRSEKLACWSILRVDGKRRLACSGCTFTVALGVECDTKIAVCWCIIGIDGDGSPVCSGCTCMVVLAAECIAKVAVRVCMVGLDGDGSPACSGCTCIVALAAECGAKVAVCCCTVGLDGDGSPERSDCTCKVALSLECDTKVVLR